MPAPELGQLAEGRLVGRVVTNDEHEVGAHGIQRLAQQRALVNPSWPHMQSERLADDLDCGVAQYLGEMVVQLLGLHAPELGVGLLKVERHVVCAALGEGPTGALGIGLDDAHGELSPALVRHTLLHRLGELPRNPPRHLPPAM